MSARKPVDVYTRVSRRGSREHLQSPREQERDARRFAEARGLVIDRVISDEDMSGGTLDRPGLQEVLNRVERGVTGGVVVAYLSRLSRDTLQGLTLLDRIRAAGGDVYAPNLPADYTNADGRMLTTIQLAVDAGYRERKREELEAAKRSAIEAGIPVATRTPTGYRARKDRTLEPDPKTAPVVREVFERRAAGEGPTALAELLAERGVKTSQGSATWTKQAVMSLIRNRVYLGELSYGRPDAPGQAPRYVNPIAHDGIVTPSVWAAAQRPGAPRVQKQRSSAGSSRYMLTGVLRCAACGYSANATLTSRGKPIYRCVGRHSGGKCPGRWSMPASIVEEAAEGLFWAQLDDVVAVGRRPATQPPDELRQELARAQARYEQIKTPEAQDAYQADYFSVVHERREAVERAAEALGHAEAAARSSASDEQIASLRDMWPNLSVAERRELMAARFDALALGRRGDEFVLGAWPVGTAPEGLSRRGFCRGAGLRPFDLPDAARVVALKDARERRGKRVV